MEEVYISNKHTGVAHNPATEGTQMEIRDILLAPAAIILNGLSDVNIENPVDEQVLRYNISTYKWENVTPDYAKGYTDRGDPISHDFEVNDFILDDEWHSLDLSSIVGESESLVSVRCKLQCEAANKKIFLRKKGNINSINVAIGATGASNLPVYKDLQVSCDSNGMIQYLVNAATWTTLIITVRGWI